MTKEAALYQPDGRHVYSEIIDIIMRIFMEGYCGNTYYESNSEFLIPEVNIEGKIIGNNGIRNKLSPDAYVKIVK